jgi:hypothetical protein
MASSASTSSSVQCNLLLLDKIRRDHERKAHQKLDLKVKLKATQTVTEINKSNPDDGS